MHRKIGRIHTRWLRVIAGKGEKRRRGFKLHLIFVFGYSVHSFKTNTFMFFLCKKTLDIIEFLKE